MKKIILAALTVVISLSLAACQEPTENQVPTDEGVDYSDYEYLPSDITLGDHLYVVPSSAMSNPQDIVLAQAIQGIVAQTEAEIYIETTTAYEDYLHILEEEYGITYEYVEGIWDLVDLFKDHFVGYSLYTYGTESENVALTYAGLTKSVPVTVTQEERMEDRGLSMNQDLRFKDTEWIVNTYMSVINWDYVIQQDPQNYANRDIGVAMGGLYFFNHYTWLTQEVYDSMGVDSPMLGWGPTDEVSDVQDLSSKGITTVASNHSWNTSIFNATDLEIDTFDQVFERYYMETKDVHYVSFILTDGDNVQWMMGDYYQNYRTYGSPSRGDIPFGWSIAPTMYDLAPTILNEYYENATLNDYLLPGVSGAGYYYPDVMPEDGLQTHVERTNEYFSRLDLDYLVVMGSRGMDTDKSSLEAYANQENIKGAFLYANFDRYMGYRGEIWWVNDKPFLSARKALWDIGDLQGFADEINAFDVDPYSISGYTMIPVHTWSHTYQDVLDLVEMFDGDVVVVSPYHMMQLIERNVPHENARPE